MANTRTSNDSPRHDGVERSQACRELAVKAERQAAQATDPEMRTTFLGVKELWLDLADEIDRRQTVAVPLSASG
jgi:hypothetical protein